MTDYFIILLTIILVILNIICKGTCTTQDIEKIERIISSLSFNQKFMILVNKDALFTKNRYFSIVDFITVNMAINVMLNFYLLFSIAQRDDVLYLL